MIDLLKDFRTPSLQRQGGDSHGLANGGQKRCFTQSPPDEARSINFNRNAEAYVRPEVCLPTSNDQGTQPRPASELHHRGLVTLITREYCTSPPIMLTQPDDAELAREAGLIPAATIDEALKLAYAMCGKQNPTIMMPKGADALRLMR